MASHNAQHSQNGKAAYKIILHKGLVGLENLREEWSSLVHTLCDLNYTQWWDWFYAYTQKISMLNQHIYFVSIYQHNQCIAILPFCIRTENFFGVKLVCLDAFLNIHMYCSDVLVASHARKTLPLEALLRRACQQGNIHWDVFHSGLVHEGTAAYDLWLQQSARFFVTEQAHSADYLPCIDYQKYLDCLSKNMRNNLKKSRNKLLKLGPLTFDVYAKNSDILAALEQFLLLERKGWKGASQTAIADDTEIQNVYQQLFSSLAENRQVRVNLLKIHQTVIAAQLAIYDPPYYRLLKITYDEDYAKISPGNMALEKLLESLVLDDDIQKLDLVTEVAWHQAWQPLKREGKNFFLFNKMSVKGVYAWGGLLAKQGVRPLYHTVVSPWVAKLINVKNHRSSKQASR